MTLKDETAAVDKIRSHVAALDEEIAARQQRLRETVSQVAAIKQGIEALSADRGQWAALIADADE